MGGGASVYAAAPAPPGASNATTSASASTALSEELREAMLGAKRLEDRKVEALTQLAELDDLLAERDKQVEVLEIEVEEEHMRMHSLQSRLLERESAAVT